MAIGTELNPFLCYKQTRGGDYDSRPDPTHVMAALESGTVNGWEWSEEAAQRGHGEYIDNVAELAEALRTEEDARTFIYTLADVARIIDQLQPVEGGKGNKQMYTEGERITYHGNQGIIVSGPDEFGEYIVKFDYQDADDEPFALRESDLSE